MLVRFLQVDLNTPNMIVLGENDFRSCFVDSLEMTHRGPLTAKTSIFFGDWGGFYNSNQELTIQTNSMTVAIQSPTVAGETNRASHLGQDSLNFLITLSHVLQIMATVSAFHLGGLNVEVP